MQYPRQGLCLLAVLVLSVCRPAKSHEVPATLDLADRARLALNALIGTTDERGEFMFRCSIVPPSLDHDAFSFSACGPKYIESMAMASLMSGVTLDESGCRRAVDYWTSCLGPDGLFYCKIGPDRPWDTASPEDWANMYGQGRTIRAMLAMHDLEGGDIWVDRLRRLARTLNKIAVRKLDAESGQQFAYFPNSPGYGDIFSYPKSGWKTTELITQVDRSEVGKSIADVPDHTFGIPLYLGGMIEPLTRYAVRFGDPTTLELAGELTRFVMMKESGWIPDGHARSVIPEQNAQFSGHFHGHTLALRGILEYGIATNNPRLKEFARSGYEFSRTMGIPRIGWFPEYTGKFSHETCGLVNMTALAIKLSRAGVGDYWDDVDAYARNHLSEAQFTNVDAFRHANKGRQLTPSDEELLKKLVGTFAGWGTPSSLDVSRIMNCCTANGSEGLYYVWDAILEERDGSVQVNLLLNRRSPWLDIESWLPYEGKVIFRIKQPQSLAVRIPGWVKKNQVQLSVDEQSQPVTWIGRSIWIANLESDSVVALKFPIEETVSRYRVDSYEVRGTKRLGQYEYQVTFRGSSVVDIAPRDGNGMAIYERAHMRQTEPPLVRQSPYVAKARIDW